ncbi:hypothetical protein [Ornithinimicrobium kibberense]|uniref:hypothetical protein n=1 Tax=Ornithinimicrobium kibberense TaxID=282060 RepID=UPI003614F1CF
MGIVCRPAPRCNTSAGTNLQTRRSAAWAPVCRRRVAPAWRPRWAPQGTSDCFVSQSIGV